MSTYDNTRYSALGLSFGGIVARFFGAIAAWNDARVTRKSLSALTARELDDIGLTRADIETIATRGSRY